MTALDELAERMGIEPEFRDARGRIVRASSDTKRKLLKAMGAEADSLQQAQAILDDLEKSEWTDPLPPVQVVRAGSPAVIDLTLPAGSSVVQWSVTLEDGKGRKRDAKFDSLELLAKKTIDERLFERRRLQLGADLPCGYHRFEVAGAPRSMSLIVTPAQCWLPERADGRRFWGIAAQLYLLRSQQNWGIGDYGDLRRLIELGAANGADVIGLNPLHALFPDQPEHASPYSPASRLLLNVLNIDVSALPELADCEPAKKLIGSEHFQETLTHCRAQRLVDYGLVNEIKLKALALLFERFQAQGRRSGRHQAFDEFRRAGGDVLQRNCVFLALREHFAGLDHTRADWHGWPDQYRNVTSAAVAAFAAEHKPRIDFFVWLQWIADQQLAAAAACARRCAMNIGLYRDLAIGADRTGAETWVRPAAVVSGAEVGAPPDIFNPAGQNWGLPPLHPRALRDEAYRSFIELVRANMRHAGGLRIDHAMGLQHLYWVPEGNTPSEGAYVRYPVDDLVGVLALESQRSRCLIVGEDLGTVPEGFRERMAQANILSYRVLYFEQDSKTGKFLPTGSYPNLALAVVGSHDLPTLRGWWEGRDIEIKQDLGLLVDKAERNEQVQQRQRDKHQLLEALQAERLLPNEPGEPSVALVARAAHAFLARTPSLLAFAQIDDLTDEVDPVNVPATSDEHPNWRRRLSLSLEQIGSAPRFLDIAELFNKERGRLLTPTA